MNYYLGIDIGGTKCSVCLGNAEGEVLDKEVFPTIEPLGPQQAIDNFLHLGKEIIGRKKIKLDSIGIACGSPLDPEAGIIQSPAQLQSWADVPIVKIFEEEFGVPAFLDNDANAGAIAEFSFGAGRGCKHMAFLTFGTGLGAGFILNGQIYRGISCYAGEIGHIRLAEDGPIGCRKSGSFEGFCSGAGIAQIAASELGFWKSTTMVRSGASAQDIGEAAYRGDPLAIKVLEISGRNLGYGLAILLDTLNLERVVIGSIFKRCEGFLRPAMEQALAAEALIQTRSACTIVASELGDLIGDLAALSIAYDRRKPRS